VFVFTSLCLTKAWSFAGPGHVISCYTPGESTSCGDRVWWETRGWVVEIAPGTPEYSADVEGAVRYGLTSMQSGAEWRRQKKT
jgi:hypothetical protein